MELVAIVIDEISKGAVTHVGVAITFGLIVMAMIYTFGDKSGCHINPAVTIAFAAYGVFPLNKILPYIISQLIGAVAASSVLKLLFSSSQNLGNTIPAGTDLQSLCFRVYSYFLFNACHYYRSGRRERKGMFVGITVGSVVLLEAMFAGPISGASMNPARLTWSRISFRQLATSLDIPC